MIMIPTGVCTDSNSIHASIVLAGDPKQLDPVTKSSYACKLHHQQSYMAYLCNQPVYRNGNLLNGDVITHLVHNYRSHPAILQVPNKNFYDGLLISSALPCMYAYSSQANAQNAQINNYPSSLFSFNSSN